MLLPHWVPFPMQVPSTFAMPPAILVPPSRYQGKRVLLFGIGAAITVFGTITGYRVIVRVFAVFLKKHLTAMAMQIE